MRDWFYEEVVDAGGDQIGVGDRPDPFTLDRDLGGQRTASVGDGGPFDDG